MNYLWDSAAILFTGNRLTERLAIGSHRPFLSACNPIRAYFTVHHFWGNKISDI